LCIIILFYQKYHNSTCYNRSVSGIFGFHKLYFSHCCLLSVSKKKKNSATFVNMYKNYDWTHIYMYTSPSRYIKSFKNFFFFFQDWFRSNALNSYIQSFAWMKWLYSGWKSLYSNCVDLIKIIKIRDWRGAII
jgi:hypothetical protein